MAKNNGEYKRDINFFAVLQAYENEQKKGEQKTGRAPKLTLLIAMLLMGLYVGGLALQENRLNAQIQTLETYVMNAENQAVFQTRSRVTEELSMLISYNKTCAAYIETLTQAPRIAQENFKKVHEKIPENTSVLDFSYTEPVLSVRCQTSDKKAPAAYAESLSKSNQFTTVNYTGFGAVNAADTTDLYVFTIECHLW